MLKFSLSFILAAGLAAAGPAFADSKSGGNDGTGRGCTLNPFTHTMRCIDFDHCTKNSKGETVCPVTTTPTKKAQ